MPLVKGLFPVRDVGSGLLKSREMTLRSWVKSAARPVTSRVYARVDHRARVQVDPFAAELRSLADRLAAERADSDRAVAAVMNAVSTQNAAARLSARVSEDVRNQIAELAFRTEYVERRMEFVRKEVLLESRYGVVGGGDGKAGAQPAVDGDVTARDVQILRPDRVEAQRGHLRLNVGAGHAPLPDYINVDSRPLDGIDVVADARHLPFDPGTVAEIFSAHFLEHFPVEELRRSVLPSLVALLEEGGAFVAVVPDMGTMVAECAAGRIPYEDFFEVTYGGQEYSGDFHFAGFTAESLCELLEEAVPDGLFVP